MGLERLIESRIQEAMAAGQFSRLDGAGQPLVPASDADRVAGENWIGFRMLQNAGLLPEWLDLGREIERDLEELQQMEVAFREWCGRAMLKADPTELADEAASRLEAFQVRACGIRAKQERFNLLAPGPLSQRPPIWVERAVERLRLLAPRDGRSRSA